MDAASSCGSQVIENLLLDRFWPQGQTELEGRRRLNSLRGGQAESTQEAVTKEGGEGGFTFVQGTTRDLIDDRVRILIPLLACKESDSALASRWRHGEFEKPESGVGLATSLEVACHSQQQSVDKAANERIGVHYAGCLIGEDFAGLNETLGFEERCDPLPEFSYSEDLLDYFGTLESA